MKILADTSVWLDALDKKRARQLSFLEILIRNDERIMMAGPVLQDILSGISDPITADEMKNILSGFACIEPVTSDYILAAELRRQLKSKGYTPGTVDLLIAALAINHDCALASYDPDLEYIASHTRLEWLNPKEYLWAKAPADLDIETLLTADIPGKHWRISMDYLKAHHLSVPYAALETNAKLAKEKVISDINFGLKKGEILGIVGPTGCGKSVLLRALAGVIEPVEGNIYKEEEDITRFKPWQRGMAMVFQDYVLYPFMTGRNNIAFPLSQKRAMKNYQPDPGARVNEIAAMLNLSEEDILKRLPRNISGGEKQRVAIGKAISVLPDILLLDEPLSNIEENFRYDMRHSLRKLIHDHEITSVYVSHNQVEIAEVADRIAVMYQGRIEQVGTYLDLYNDPKRFFVSQFIGEKTSNYLTASEIQTLTEGKLFHAVTIRPSECVVGEGDFLTLEGEILLVENFIDEGSKILFIERDRPGFDNLFGVEVDIDYEIEKGDRIKIGINKDKAKFFDQNGDRVYNLW